MVIYKITNTINNKVCIGQTCQKPNTRWSQHKSELRNNKHRNPHLQSSWNKYGEENFKFEVIDDGIDIWDLDNLERYWIDKCQSMNSNFGFNKRHGGHDRSGYTEESKKKMSESQKRYFSTEEGKKRLQEAAEKKKGKIPWNKDKKLGPSWNKGIPRTEEQKKAHSKKLKGRPNCRKGIKTGLIALNAKKIKCIETGEIFESILAASKHFNGRREHLRDHLKKVKYRPRFKGLHFEYYNE